MTFPIETVFAMLAIEMFRSVAQPEGLPPPSTKTVLLVTAAWAAWSYLLGAALARRVHRRLRREQSSTLEVFEDFRFRVVIQKVVLVVLCFAHTYFTRWPVFVEEVLGLPSWSVVDDLAAIAPFMAAMLAGWAATFRADRALSRRSWGLGEYVWFQARYSLLLVLVPWLILKGIDDSREIWPERLKALAGTPWTSALFFALVVGAAAAFLPLFLKRLFRATSMPDGELRRRLEALLARSGLRFRDILVWRMQRARILNAGVMGVLPRYRYVMFSDSLIEALTPAECEAVLAHEIAHTKHRHAIVYLVFALGFVALAYDVMALMPSGLRSDFMVGMPVLAILVVGYFRFVFGYLSRAFERQADVCAAELLGSPVPLVLALEKIALMSGDVRELRSWRHHSVAERVRYLTEVGYEPAAIARYHARSARIARAVVAGVALMAALAGWLSLREGEGPSAQIAVLEEIVAQQPRNHHAWTRLAEHRARSGDKLGALEAFREALRNNPRLERAREGLLALELPEDAKRRALAQAYLDAGFPREALPEARAAAAAGPLEPANLAVLARALLDCARPDEALAQAEKGLALAPGDAELSELRERIRSGRPGAPGPP